MRKTARKDLIECVGSWPGVLLRELIDDGELNHSTDHLVAEVSRMRAAGYLEPCYPARLRVKPEWRKIVQTMRKRDQFAAAAIAAGARSYRQLADATQWSLTVCYHCGSRLVEAGAVYRTRALFLTGQGQIEYLKIRQNLTGSQPKHRQKQTR